MIEHRTVRSDGGIVTARSYGTRLGSWVARTVATVVALPLSVLALATTLVPSVIAALVSVTVVGSVAWIVPFRISRWWLRLAARYCDFVGVAQTDDLEHRAGGRAQLHDRRSWRRLLAVGAGLPASALAAFGAYLTVVLAVRFVYYPIAAAGHPDYYRPAWGGPTYLGACAVHMIPCVVALVLAPWIIHRLHRLQARAWSYGSAGDGDARHTEVDAGDSRRGRRNALV